MPAISDAACGGGSAPPMRTRTLQNLREDNRLLRDGILDPVSFREGYLAKPNPVELVVRHGEGAPAHLRGTIKAIRRTHNVRTNAGGRWMQRLMMGGVSGTLGTATLTGTSTAVGATSLTNSGASFPASTAVTAGNDTANGSALAGQSAIHKDGLVGMIVQTGAVWGVIVKSTGTVLTVDQWYAVGANTGAAASTPGTGVYNVLPGQAPCLWVALSSNATALTTSNLYTSDTSLPGEIVAASTPTSGSGTGTGSGLLRAYVPITSLTGPATAQTAVTGNVSCSFTYSKTFTAASTGVWSVTGAALYLGAITAVDPQASPMPFENAMTLASLSGPNGDQATLSWAVTLN